MLTQCEVLLEDVILLPTIFNERTTLMKQIIVIRHSDVMT